MASYAMDDPLFTIEQLADYISTPRSTIYVWRTEGKGPAAARVGRRVLFRKSVVDAWLDSRTEDLRGA